MLQRPPFPRINRNAPLAKGLVFAGVGGGASTLQMTDASGYGNHGTLTDMDPVTDWIFDSTLGRWVLDFDGVNDVVALGNVLDLQPPLSLCAMVKVISVGNTNNTIIARRTSGVYSWHFRLKGTTGALSLLTTSGAKDSTLTATAIDGWCHLAVCLSSGGITTFYKNGIAQTPGGAQTITSGLSNETSIGKHTTDALAAIMTDILVHNRALSPAEIQQLADPSDPMLHGLILPPVRRLWAVPSGAAFKPWWAVQQLRRLQGAA